ncbi:MAG: NADH-quinone oxidoreductase subunit J [Gammaproteobacteria bacterium]|nr:NADH-quinone oxidoreductase subunit J [Gammaproteobacteria bacterium]
MTSLALFSLFAGILVFAGLMVVTVRNPVYAALFLVLAFFSSAALWMLLEAEFLSLALVLVYVGAVMVLFLFVVMMLDVQGAPLREGFVRYLPVGALVAGVAALELFLVVGSDRLFGTQAFPPPQGAGAAYSNTQEIGAVLYTKYVYPFEIAAVILLVAIVAAIALSLRRRGDARSQRTGDQVRVRREDRVRLVAMPAEKGE